MRTVGQWASGAKPVALLLSYVCRERNHGQLKLSYDPSPRQIGSNVTLMNLELRGE